MIFFNIPSVGQLKPETFFGNDDHYGFVSTLFKEAYDRQKVKEDCAKYYNKNSLKYWDQIITLINACGIKRLDENKCFTNIPLVDFAADEYDKNNHKPAELLFQFYLVNWQFPHPILTKSISTNHPKLAFTSKNLRRDYDYIKPYPLILNILLSLKKIKFNQSFLKNDEFYWLFYKYLKQENDFMIHDFQSLANQIYKMRLQGGWKKYNLIKNDAGTKTHLSYPKGFLKNSKLLSDDFRIYNIERKDYFIGLDQGFEEKIIKKEIDLSNENIFEFNRDISSNDLKLNNDFSYYMNDTIAFEKWKKESYLHNTQIYSYLSEKRIILNSQDNFAFQLNRLNTLDKKSESKSRTEQHILRKYLFQNDTTKSKCCLCSKEFPLNLLTAAHIKKREYCDENERKDVHVVMPACNLGCDILYEKGYIIVKDGTIKSNMLNKQSTQDLKRHIETIENSSCEYWNSNNQKYFESHEKKHT